MKRIKSIVIVACLTITAMLGSIVGNFENYGAEDYQKKLNNALDMYFLERENEFLGNNSMQRTMLSEIEEERLQSIEEWKEELEIDVVAVDIEYSIRDIIDNKDGEIKLLVYEWVTIDYKCVGYEVIETMGFGTDHLVTLANKNEGLEILDDVYSEIIGYESGSEQERLELHGAIETFDEMIVSKITEAEIVMQPYAIGAPLTYNPTLAVDYSNQWCGNSNPGTSSGTMTPANYNPQFYYYPGADCCNFVSQCLYAGGLRMKGNWTATFNTSGTVTAGGTSKSGKAWRHTPTFEEFWVEEGYTVSRITTASQAVIGNPIYRLARDGYDTNHVMLIVGTNAAGRVLVNAHNNDVYNYPINLSTKVYYTINIVHNHNYKISTYSALNHTYECTICEHWYTEEHYMQTFMGFQSCVTCDYTIEN